MRTVANSALRLRLQRAGRISGAARRGDSDWGFRMVQLKAIGSRWKPYNKLKYDTKFPFRELPDSENP